MRRIDPEKMEHVRERMERIRDHVPSEEFNETTALMIAKGEVEPLYQPGDSDGE
ncbi:MAG: hypothetical protein QOE26_2732 [Verrucomicrobiota bacterium]|jgi:hypothetical protein